MARSLADRLLSLVVPPLCVACREPELSGDAVCARCRDSLTLRRATNVDRGVFLTLAWSPFEYDEAAQRIVMALKARAATRAAAFMATAIAARAPAGLLQGVVVPVPGHPGGNRRRGFDHASLIAGHLGRLAGLPVAESLCRTQAPPQVGLARPERRANASGAVALRDGASPVDRMVLVDDVYTTGATLDACAEALLAGGAGDVVGACFARTERRPGDRWRNRHRARSIGEAMQARGSQEVNR